MPALLATALCAEVADCFDASTVHQLFGDAGCKERLLAQVEDGDFAFTKVAVAAGRVVYDATRVDACLNQLKGLGCNFSTTRALLKDGCRAVLTGKVERGGDCAVDADCKGVSFCKRRAKCPGTCSALLQAGASCEQDDECEDGLSCADDGTCKAPAQTGEACGGGKSAACMPGLACLGEDTTKGITGLCKPIAELLSAKLDETCDIQGGILCEAGLSCVVSTKNGMATSSCKQPVAADGPCAFGVPSPCSGDQYCDADITQNQTDGTCKPLPVAGDSCASVPGSPACAPGLECDSDQRCYAVSRLGQPCKSAAGCASKLCANGTCERPLECTLKN